MYLSLAINVVKLFVLTMCIHSRLCLCVLNDARPCYCSIVTQLYASRKWKICKPLTMECPGEVNHTLAVGVLC